MTYNNKPSEIRLETAYIPPVSWLRAAWHAETIHLEAHENYQKGSRRNRCHIAGPNGLQRLSIPLEKGKHQQTPIREVRMADTENWATMHWRSIQTAYGNAPFFEFYADEIENLLLRRPTDLLFDFNLLWIEWLLRKFRRPARIEFSTTWTPPTGQADDFRGRHDQITDTYTPYPQVFSEKHGFMPNLSALDLLLCCGPKAENWIGESGAHVIL